MQKIFSLLLIIFLSGHAYSQSETFDIVTYTPPKSWKKEVKDGVINYTNVDTNSGRFCVITIYASTTSSGDVKKDFSKSWKELVVDPYKGETNPKTESQTTAEGWKVMSAVAPIKVNGADLYMMLSVVTGFGKTLNIRTSLNDQVYAADIDALFASMQLNKSKPVGNTNSLQAGSSGAKQKFGSMLYVPPAGWNHQVYQDGVVIRPQDLPAGEYLGIQIMPPLKFSGSLEQALAASFDEAATMYKGTTMNYAGTGKKYQQTEAKRSFNGWEYMVANGGVRIGAGEYPPEYGLTLFTIKVNNRFERIAILKTRTINRTCSMSSYYADERQIYKDAIDNFLYSIQFADASGTLMRTGTINGNGIVGVWQGISMSVGTPSVSQPLGVGYKVFTPIFLTNGQAYFGPKFPSQGLDSIDTRVLAELHRRDWGTYSFSNGKGILKMPYGDIPMRLEGNKLVITPNQTDHRFAQMPSVDGARFQGTYTMSEAYGKIPSIRFTSDGKFVDNGAVRVLYHEYMDCINPALQPGSGTYEVKDYTVHFNYADGRKIKIAFIGTGFDMKNQSPQELRMSNNEDPLIRQ